MLAIDQRGSLRKMIGARRQTSSKDVTAEEMRRVKRIVTASIGPLATAVLTDPIYGYPAGADGLPPSTGLLLAAEVTGYEAANEQERRSRLLEEWSVEDALRTGADGVKLLVWHHPDASSETHRHQQDVVQALGEQCAASEMPFVLEAVTYALDGEDPKGESFARLKPDLVVDAARTYSDPRFQVTLLKLEFPANLKNVEEFQSSSFAADGVVYGLSEVRSACQRLNAAAGVPWVILSAGVDPDEFLENVRLANEAGSSGFLCGRVVWKHVLDAFPDESRMRALSETQGRRHFERIRNANDTAKPWHQHARFARVHVEQEITHV